MDCHSPGQGLMPASFKVRTVPLEGDDTATEEVLDPDFGEAAIGRVAPVDSGNYHYAIRPFLYFSKPESFFFFRVMVDYTVTRIWKKFRRFITPGKNRCSNWNQDDSKAMSR